MVHSNELAGAPLSSNPTLPAGWSRTTTGALCDCIVPNRDKPKTFTGSIPWITLPDLASTFVVHSSRAGLGLTEEEVRLYRARVIPKGSVVMSCVGRFGISAVLGQEAVINQQMHAFLVPNELSAEYLAYCIQTQREFMEKNAAATTIAYLNQEKCNSIPIALPPLAEQRRIVAELERRFSVIDALEAQVIANLKRARQLRQAVLRCAFEGSLVSQDPKEEPASALLARIKAEHAAGPIASNGRQRSRRTTTVPGVPV